MWLRGNSLMTARVRGNKVPFSAFRHCGTYSVLDSYRLESFVAHEEQEILHLYEQNNLCVQHPPYRGWWCGAEPTLSFGDNYQDIIIASKD